MANQFSKEERVMFEDVMEGFNDFLVLSKNVSTYNVPGAEMERANNVVWRPQPYIAASYNGPDVTTNVHDYIQLSVPATIGFQKSVPFALTALEARDQMQSGQLANAARQRLASDLNTAVLSAATTYGSLFVKRTAAASGFDDIAEVDAVFNEQGVPAWDRSIALSSRDYNGMASDLQRASRSSDNPTWSDAYRKAFVGTIGGFDTFKLDYSNRKTAAAGSGITMDTTGAFYHVPRATTIATTGEASNVDNRFQTITVSSTTSVAAGDAFTVANIFSCHHITKTQSPTLKTFRVVSVPSSTTLVITPPMITGTGGTDAEVQYQNCTLAATSASAALVWLNTTTAAMNPFWQKDAIEIIPASYGPIEDGGAMVRRAKTDNGMEVVMTKQFNALTYKMIYRFDAVFGVVNKQPEMSGIMMFSQV